MKSNLIALLISFGLMACQPIVLSDDLKITMENSPSPKLRLGSRYKLTVAANGDVIFDGTSHVKTTGPVTTTLSKQKIQELVTAFDEANFFSFWDYDCSWSAWLAPCLSDQQTTILSIQVNGRTKTVKHNHGDTLAPQSLVDLERKIHAIVNTQQWLLPASD